MKDFRAARPYGFGLLVSCYAAGTALAAFLIPVPPPWLPALLLCLAAVLLAASACLRSRSRGLILPLFFIMGGFSLLSYRLLPPYDAMPWLRTWLDDCMDGLCSLMDSAGFEGEHTAPLLKAILAGRRDGLGRDVTEAFRASGASHILALSGLHLGIIYGILSKLLMIIGNSPAASRLRAVMLVLGCGFYAVATGASPSIVRAFLFVLIRETASQHPARDCSPLHVFCIALFVQLVLTPEVVASPGFQLSYLAMLGIFVLFPRLEAWYPSSGEGRGDAWNPVRMLWKSMALSISCQVFTAPLVWALFGTFPKYFLLTNLVALPLVEMLAVCSVACLALVAAGMCPPFLVSAVDALAGALVFCLETIASM